MERCLRVSIGVKVRRDGRVVAKGVEQLTGRAQGDAPTMDGRGFYVKDGHVLEKLYNKYIIRDT